MTHEIDAQAREHEERDDEHEHQHRDRAAIISQERTTLPGHAGSKKSTGEDCAGKTKHHVTSGEFFRRAEVPVTAGGKMEKIVKLMGTPAQPWRATNAYGMTLIKTVSRNACGRRIKKSQNYRFRCDALKPRRF
ncbi:MAG: hypothetical protein AAFR84_16750 [Pseudomonadota bacterium]